MISVTTQRKGRPLPTIAHVAIQIAIVAFLKILCLNGEKSEKVNQEDDGFPSTHVLCFTCRPHASASPFHLQTHLFIGGRSLTDQIHKLVEFRRDDNLRTTVALLANLCVVRGNGVILTTATGSQTLRVNTIVVL